MYPVLRLSYLTEQNINQASCISPVGKVFAPHIEMKKKLLASFFQSKSLCPHYLMSV